MQITPLALEVLIATALLGCYHSYGRTLFLKLHPEDGSRIFLRNLGTHLRNNIQKLQEIGCTLKKEAVYSSESFGNHLPDWTVSEPI